MQALQQLTWGFEHRQADVVEHALEQLFNDAQSSQQAALILDQNRSNNWATLVWHWSRAATIWHTVARSDASVAQIFQELKNALSSLYDEMRNENSGNWFVPIAALLCRYLVQCAARVQVERSDPLRTDRDRRARLAEAETIIKRGLALMINDRSAEISESKKLGALGMIVYLLRIYFALNNLRMCASLVRTVESPGFPPLDDAFPLDQRVTYHYFVGRIALYEDRYVEAETHLAFAAHHCPVRYERNRKRIWTYLVPVRLLQGRLPSVRLLRKYRLRVYERLREAVIYGDIRQFDDVLRRYGEFFIQSGLLFTVEKLRLIVYRNRFRVAVRLLNSTRIPLAALQCALTDPKPALDELECLVANLIYRGFIRGYVSHQKKYLVTSAKDAFPDIARVSPGVLR